MRRSRKTSALLARGYEEPGAPDETLKNYPNVVLSPHIAVAQRPHNLADTAELVGNLAEVLGS